jgi:hypothetical protein
MSLSLKICIYSLLIIATVFSQDPISSLINQAPKSWVRQYRKPNLNAVVHVYENGFDWDTENHVGFVTMGHLGTYGTQTVDDLYGIFHTNQSWLYSHNTSSFAKTKPMDRPVKRCGGKTYYDAYAKRFVLYGGGFGGHTDNGYYEIMTDGKSLTKEINRGLGKAINPWVFDAKTRQWYEMRSLMEGPDDADYRGYGPCWAYVKEYGVGMLLPALGGRAFMYSVHSNSWALLQTSNPSLAITTTRNLPMAYDVYNRKVVVVEGSSTYTYDFGTRTWERISTASAPSTGSEGWYNGYSAMAYDINSQRTIFISHNGTQTWSFNLDARSWTRETTLGNPPNSGSMGEGLTYDPLNHITVLYSNRYDEIWTFRQAGVNANRLDEVKNFRSKTSANAVTLSWEVPVFGLAPDKYYIYRAAWKDHLTAIQGLEPGPYQLIDSTAALTYTDAPQKTTKTFYSYSVLPVKGTAKGIMSIPAFSNRPVPMGLIATAFSRNRVGLKWVADTASDVAGYNVYRKYGAIPARHELVKINTSLVGPKPVFIDSAVNIIGDTIVTYVVTTVNAYGQESGLSPRADTRIDRVMGLWADTVNLKFHWFPTMVDTFQEYQIWTQALVCRDCGAAPFAKVPYPAFKDTAQIFSLPMANQYHFKIRVVNAIGQIGYFSDLVPLASRGNDLHGMFRGDGMFSRPSYDPFWDKLGLAPDEVGNERGPDYSRDDNVVRIRAFPNPFNAKIQIAVSCQLSAISKAKLNIFNVNGKNVKRLAADSRQLRAGITWNAACLASGIYFLKVKILNKTYSRKIILQH